MSKPGVAVVVPNWNGQDSLEACLNSLAGQSLEAKIIVVDNGSTDNSKQIIEKKYPDVILLENLRNLGFAGGVNTGIRWALAADYELVALLNNDAVAETHWLEQLVSFLRAHPSAGIVTGKILTTDKKHIDSTGDIYSSWGLPYPRGRGEADEGRYDSLQWVFGASGGASLYRAAVFEQIGLFDEDFFAYYEDVDLSFRAQLAGWKVGFEHKALVYHEIGATSRRIKGFTTYQTMKNYQFLMWKNVPGRLLPGVLVRFSLAHSLFFLSAVGRGQAWPATKGLVVGLALLPKKLAQRRKIQRHRAVGAGYIASIMSQDLPPNARRLRALRSGWRKLWGKK